MAKRKRRASTCGDERDEPEDDADMESNGSSDLDNEENEACSQQPLTASPYTLPIHHPPVLLVQPHLLHITFHVFGLAEACAAGETVRVALLER